MATLNDNSNGVRSEPPGEYRTASCSDETTLRIYAYLTSVRTSLQAAPLDYYYEGRALIAKLANSAQGTHIPSLRLTPEQCADVLYFITMSEPVNPDGWWRDPEDGPSHVIGYNMVLAALEESLRSQTREVQS